MIKPSATLLSPTITPGCPVGWKVLFMSRATPSADPTAIDLTGYTAHNVLLKRVDDDEDWPDATATADLTLTAALATQTGSERGHVYLTATGATTAALAGEGIDRLAFDVLLTSANGTQEVWARGFATVLEPVSTTSDSSSAVNTADLTQFVQVLDIGPTSEAVTTDPVDVDLTQTTGTVEEIYTATADGVIPTTITLRLKTISGFTSVPRVTIRKQGGANYVAATTLTGLDAAGETRVFSLSGVVPALNTGDKIEVYINTAAGATEYICGAEVRT
jgi:hypothetical protein